MNIEDLPTFDATSKDIKALAGPCSESLDFALNSGIDRVTLDISLRSNQRNDILPLEKTTMVPTITRDELKRKIDLKDHFLLVETLPATAYHHAHLPGAINLPPDQIDKLAPQLLLDKNADIVVYCASPT